MQQKKSDKTSLRKRKEKGEEEEEEEVEEEEGKAFYFNRISVIDRSGFLDAWISFLFEIRKMTIQCFDDKLLIGT